MSSADETGEAKRSPVMINGNQISRMDRAAKWIIDLADRLGRFREDLGTEITARRREDPSSADVSCLMDRYNHVDDLRRKAFDSMGSLSSALTSFGKELADLKAAPASTDYSSVGGWSSDALSSYLDLFDKEVNDLSSAAQAAMAIPISSATIMISGNLVARMNLAIERIANLERSLDALTADLGTEIKARMREDPCANINDLCRRYLDLDDIQLRAFDLKDSLLSALASFGKELADLKAPATGSSTDGWSSEAFSSYLDVFEKELADLAAATEAAMATKSDDTIDGDHDKTSGTIRSRI